MPEGMTTPFPKALYLRDSGAFEKIYGEEERATVAGLADVYAPLQTGNSVAKNPGVLAEAEVILSGWGAPAMDGGFLAAAPTCGSCSTGRNLSVVWQPRPSGNGASASRAPTPPTPSRSPSTPWRRSCSPSS